jgi:WD40 repeat protein
LQATVVQHNGAVVGLDWIDVYKVVSAGADGKLAISPTSAPFRSYSTYIQGDPFTALAVYPGAPFATIATSDSAGNIVLWSEEGKPLKTFPQERKLKGGITHLAWERNKPNLAIGANDGAIAIWFTDK